ncbi:hypothetical protein M413DRAFT_248379 [Hebeloma cylindrosporum]|uniref:Uncharacterized protein n=1 Tax=Hebeloma cylindrosporum TaxID=76867 RepID=A0A0C3C3S9_HEBCY|nr:hypothetical protein M413DRAFT_248379 [Hebeloma cylindrosporum h7]
MASTQRFATIHNLSLKSITQSRTRAVRRGYSTTNPTRSVNFPLRIHHHHHHRLHFLYPIHRTNSGGNTRTRWVEVASPLDSTLSCSWSLSPSLS